MRSIKSRAAAAVMAGLMAVGTVAPATAAFAVNNTPSVGDQTGTGKTDLTMILEDVSEHGGTEDPANPDTNPKDNLGDNLAFTVPTSINYVVQADGDLLGPSAGAAFIENRSNFKTHVSSVQVNNQGASGASGFRFVADLASDTASQTPTANAVELHFGPADDQLNAASYTTKAAVHDATKWNMAATNGAHATGSTREDEVQLTTSGKVARISADITSQTKFGEIHWYLTPGEAS